MKTTFYYLLILFFNTTVTISLAADVKKEKSLRHVLLLQWTKGISQEDKSEILDLFKGLPDKVNGFEAIEIYDLTKSSGEYDIVLVLQFTSEETLKEYENHSDHKKIVELAPDLVSKVGEFDYWK